jgi:hypothetical protein
MRAIKNLISEAELVTDAGDPAWPAVWGAEVLGRAIGHELRWELVHGEPQRPPVLASFIDPSLDKMLIAHHVADVL